jgi:hypothetical protein
MTIHISCPNCNFSKEIPEEKIPVGTRWATCPQCKSRFELALPESRFDFEQDEGGIREESQAQRKATDWENRSELGIWNGIYQTFKAVLFSPARFFGTMSFEGGMKEPLAFGLLLGSIGSMFGLFWHFLMTSGGLLAFGHEFIGQFTMSILFIGIMILSPLFVTITIFFTSAILHVLLLMLKAGTNGFEATFRVVSYSQAAQILGLVPFIGGFIGGIWFLIVQVIGLREIHETSYLRIIIALLIPLALVFFLVMAVMISVLVLGAQ